MQKQNSFTIGKVEYFLNEAVLVAASNRPNGTAPEHIKVRLKDENEHGEETSSIMPYYEAQSLANERDLDLVSFIIVKNDGFMNIISQICDASKMKYQAQKQQNKSKQIVQQTHILQFKTGAAEYDLNTKIRLAVDEMVRKNAIIKIKMQISGRDMPKVERNRQQFNRCIELLVEEFNSRKINNKKLDIDMNKVQEVKFSTDKRKDDIYFEVRMINS